jgi:hypothetical protein
MSMSTRSLNALSRKNLLRLLAVPLAFALSAESCDETRGPEKVLKVTLRGYASAWRWGNPEQLLGFQEPDFAKKHPDYKFQIERLAQYHVGSYIETQVRRSAEDKVEQVVTIDLVNEHTQAVKAVVDRQEWRWDEKAQHWWLTTGLPDLSAN